MYKPLRMRAIVTRVGAKSTFRGGETPDVQFAILMAAGLTKLGRLLPPDQTIPMIPTLAAHGHEL